MAPYTIEHHANTWCLGNYLRPGGDLRVIPQIRVAFVARKCHGDIHAWAATGDMSGFMALPYPGSVLMPVVF